MTVIFTTSNFWIEYILLTVSIPDAAGTTISAATNLEREGFFVGGALMHQDTTNNDNSQAIAFTQITDQSSADLTYGTSISGLRVRIFKQAGTAGATSVSVGVLVCIRK